MLSPAGGRPGADGQALAVALARAAHPAGAFELQFVERVDALPQASVQAARAGDVVITMGAGSIGQVPQRVRELAGGER